MIWLAVMILSMVFLGGVLVRELCRVAFARDDEHDPRLADHIRECSRK